MYENNYKYLDGTCKESINHDCKTTTQLKFITTCVNCYYLLTEECFQISFFVDLTSQRTY